MTYEPNPERGCGTKKDNSWYMECEITSEGTAVSWVYCFGSHINDGRNFMPNVSAVGMQQINMPASLLDGLITNRTDHPMYEALAKKIGILGWLDYVGDGYYSGMSFANEAITMGVSRKVTKENAMLALETAPTVILFLKKMPLFSTIEDAQRVSIMAIDYLQSRAILDGNQRESYRMGPCWLEPDWSFEKDGWWGDTHYMRLIMTALHWLKADTSGPSDFGNEMREMARLGKFRAMPFGMSIINRVSYTKPLDGKEMDRDANKFGVSIIDLEAL